MAAQVLPAKIAAQIESPDARVPNVPSLKIEARLVVLDVSVVGKDGKPVIGLTADDFEVLEDGKPQQIRALDGPQTQALPAESVAAAGHAVFDPAVPASFGRSAVNVLVLDLLNTQFADGDFARRQLRDFLTAQPALLNLPTALLLVSEKGFRELSGFTRNRAQLLKTLGTVGSNYPWLLELNGKMDFGPVERLDRSLRALEKIAQSYSPIAGRKNLIWVGGGFPTINPTTIDGDDALEVKHALEHVTDTLMEARITFYAVDPTSTAAGMTEITDSSQAAFLLTAGDAVSGDMDPFSSNADFDKLAEETGGRLVRGKNDLTQQIDGLVDTGSEAYMLSYKPSNQSEAAARYRRIQVICKCPGITVATRKGYYTTGNSANDRKADAAYDLTTGAESEMPLRGLKVNVQTTPTGSEYLIRVGAERLGWKSAADGGSDASVYILAAFLDAKGKMVAHFLHEGSAHARAGTNLTDPTKIAEFVFPIHPAHQTETLRFIVRDNATGRMGSADLLLSAR